MVDDVPAEAVQVRQSESARRVPGWVVVLGVVVFVVLAGAVGILVYQWQHVRGLVAGLNDAAAEVRAKSCYRLGSHPGASQAVVDLLREEQDSEVCEAACYALQKMGASQAVEVFPGVISRLEDTPPLAKIIGYYARLGGKAVAEEIERLSRCGQTYREIGGGVGLLELEDVRGAGVLLGYAAAEDAFVREYAAHLLRRYCEPMMEMVGQPVDLSTQQGKGFSDEQLAAVRTWWLQRDRTRELGDFNAWSRRDDPAWHQLKRLKHAREKASRLVGLSE